jgi:hypothetical protein
LQKIKDLREKAAQKTYDYGEACFKANSLAASLEAQKEEAESVRQEIMDLNRQYNKFVRELYKKYGKSAVNLDTGELLESVPNS